MGNRYRARVNRKLAHKVRRGQSSSNNATVTKFRDAAKIQAQNVTPAQPQKAAKAQPPKADVITLLDGSVINLRDDDDDKAKPQNATKAKPKKAPKAQSQNTTKVQPKNETQPQNAAKAQPKNTSVNAFRDAAEAQLHTYKPGGHGIHRASAHPLAMSVVSNATSSKKIKKSDEKKKGDKFEPYAYVPLRNKDRKNGLKSILKKKNIKGVKKRKIKKVE